MRTLFRDAPEFGGFILSRCARPAGSFPEALRKWPRLGALPGFAIQCEECGRRGPFVDVLDVLAEGVDPGLVFLADISKGSTGLGGQGNSGRREFQKFYRSASWKRQRERVLARDQYRCADCGAPASCVAHIGYANPIESTPDRLVKASCDDCNQAERVDRITRKVMGE